MEDKMSLHGAKRIQKTFHARCFPGEVSVSCAPSILKVSQRSAGELATFSPSVWHGKELSLLNPMWVPLQELYIKEIVNRSWDKADKNQIFNVIVNDFQSYKTDVTTFREQKWSQERSDLKRRAEGRWMTCSQRCWCGFRLDLCLACCSVSEKLSRPSFRHVRVYSCRVDCRLCGLMVCCNSPTKKTGPHSENRIELRLSALRTVSLCIYIYKHCVYTHGSNDFELLHSSFFIFSGVSQCLMTAASSVQHALFLSRRVALQTPQMWVKMEAILNEWTLG